MDENAYIKPQFEWRTAAPESQGMSIYKLEPTVNVIKLRFGENVDFRLEEPQVRKLEAIASCKHSETVLSVSQAATSSLLPPGNSQSII